jgi:hypothetical protein
MNAKDARKLMLAAQKKKVPEVLASVLEQIKIEAENGSDSVRISGGIIEGVAEKLDSLGYDMNPRFDDDDEHVMYTIVSW